MHIQKEREAFVKWFESRYIDDIHPDSTIGIVSWEAWQAAKAQAVQEGFVLISKNDLKMELCSIRHLNSGEYSKSIIEDCVCNIEAMIEAREQKG